MYIIKKGATSNINSSSQISDGRFFEVINLKAPIYSKFLIAFKIIIANFADDAYNASGVVMSSANAFLLLLLAT